MAWFRQRDSSLLRNFSFKFHVHVLCGCRQKPNDCQLCHFVMAALWFWTMFNYNPPIAHCHPLLWGGGILVDHWSTISSFCFGLLCCYNISRVGPCDHLTHWGRVTYICVGKLAITSPDNGLSPGRHQAFIWTIAGISLIGPLGTNFSEMLIEIQTFSLKKIRFKMKSMSFRLQCCNPHFSLWHSCH